MLRIEILKSCHTVTNTFTLNINLEIPLEKGCAVFFGHSGAGKTFTMHCIAGFTTPDEGMIEFKGDVFFDSRSRINLPPQARRVGFMPQDYALFPHMTLLENVVYSRSGLTGRFPGKKQKLAGFAILERFGLADLHNHIPAQLSGGQKQRAALVRALFSLPRLILLDEPFSALDPALREKIRAETKAILEEAKVPSLIITHDPADVEFFGGDLHIFENGRAFRQEKGPERFCAENTKSPYGCSGGNPRH